MTDTGPQPNLDDVYYFRVTMPLKGGSHLVCRIPAGSAEVARRIGTGVAAEISAHSGVKIDTQNIAAENLDGKMTDEALIDMVKEKQAEADHWRRVVAGLAEKFGMLAYLSRQEYDRAKPDELTAVTSPLGPGLSYTVKGTFGRVIDAATRGVREPKIELFPVFTTVAGRDIERHRGRQVYVGEKWRTIREVFANPDTGCVELNGGIASLHGADLGPITEYPVRDVLPEGPNGEDDPDARMVRASDLPAFARTHLQICQGEIWSNLVASRDGGGGAVIILADDGSTVIDPDGLVIVRPMAGEWRAADLTLPAAVGQEMLFDNEWQEVRSAKHDQDAAVVTVQLSGRPPFPLDENAAVLVRTRPERWY